MFLIVAVADLGTWMHSARIFCSPRGPPRIGLRGLFSAWPKVGRKPTRMFPASLPPGTQLTLSQPCIWLFAAFVRPRLGHGAMDPAAVLQLEAAIQAALEVTGGLTNEIHLHHHEQEGPNREVLFTHLNCYTGKSFYSTTTRESSLSTTSMVLGPPQRKRARAIDMFVLRSCCL